MSERAVRASRANGAGHWGPASERVGGSAGAKPPGSDHDDFGGLHRDLLATGSRMDRRSLFRLAARAGIGAGALQLLGCSNSATATTPTGAGGTSSGACS